MSKNACKNYVPRMDGTEDCIFCSVDACGERKPFDINTLSEEELLALHEMIVQRLERTKGAELNHG